MLGNRSLSAVVSIAARAPGQSTKEPSADQIVVREKFQRAILYGKPVVADPLMKKEYENRAEPGKSVFNVAVADFFQAPNILEVDLTGYTGQVGQPIRIRVTDNLANDNPDNLTKPEKVL